MHQAIMYVSVSAITLTGFCWQLFNVLNAHLECDPMHLFLATMRPCRIIFTSLRHLFAIFFVLTQCFVRLCGNLDWFTEVTEI